MRAVRDQDVRKTINFQNERLSAAVIGYLDGPIPIENRSKVEMT